MRFDIHKADENTRRYLKPPTWEYIESFVNEIGISISQCERFYGLPAGHLHKVKCGYMELGRSFWHFFYERIVPQYGIEFTKNQLVTKTIPNFIPRTVTKTIPNVANQSANDASNSASVAHLPDSHTRLITVK